MNGNARKNLAIEMIGKISMKIREIESSYVNLTSIQKLHITFISYNSGTYAM